MAKLKHHSSFWIDLDRTRNKPLCDLGLPKKHWMEVRVNNRVYCVPRAEATVIRKIIRDTGVDFSHIIVKSSNEVAKIMKKAREDYVPVEKKKALLEEYINVEGGK